AAAWYTPAAVTDGSSARMNRIANVRIAGPRMGTTRFGPTGRSHCAVSSVPPQPCHTLREDDAPTKPHGRLPAQSCLRLGGNLALPQNPAPGFKSTIALHVTCRDLLSSRL